MTIPLEVVISSPTDSVDMKAGLDTLQGVSDAARKIGETVLGNHLAQRLHHNGGVRTTLKKTFKGSYGQSFTLDVHDAEYRKALKRLGNSVLVELVRYFLNEAMYEDGVDLSEKAQEKIDRMGVLAVDLVQEIRTSCIPNIHEVPKKFGHSVVVRYRRNKDLRETISHFNERTSLVLLAETDPVEIELIAGITRFNINTGNGRLQVRHEKETSAFGFSGAYAEVRFEAKKVFSNNLDFNNGIDPDKWKYIRLVVNPVKLKDGRVIKYIVKRYYED